MCFTYNNESIKSTLSEKIKNGKKIENIKKLKIEMNETAFNKSSIIENMKKSVDRSRHQVILI